MSCGSYGYAGVVNGTPVRLYTKGDCDAMGGNWSHNGECLKKEGGSWSWDCRGLNDITTTASPTTASISSKALEIVNRTLPPSITQSPYFIYGAGAVGVYVLFKLMK